MIGFQAFTNYTPHTDKSKKMILHSNRTIIHPDYCGVGLGIKIINETSKIITKKGYKVMAKFSSIPVYKSMLRQKELWKFKNHTISYKRRPSKCPVSHSERIKVKMFSFEFIGG